MQSTYYHRFLTPEQRFWQKVHKEESGCWTWLGAKSSRGHGVFEVNGKQTPAHRFAYELLFGALDDHLNAWQSCTKAACVNPDHWRFVPKFDRGSYTVTPRAQRRFWSKVIKEPEGCWLWQGAKAYNGYGFTCIDRIQLRAHRVSYELLVGPVPDGHVLHHICNVPACVNPAHLAPLSIHEHPLAGESPCARNARKTHCEKGHALIPGNLVNTKGRLCLTCSREYQATWHRNRRAALRTGA